MRRNSKKWYFSRYPSIQIPFRFSFCVTDVLTSSQEVCYVGAWPWLSDPIRLYFLSKINCAWQDLNSTSCISPTTLSLCTVNSTPSPARELTKTSTLPQKTCWKCTISTPRIIHEQHRNINWKCVSRNRLDFRRSLGPPREETAGRVSGLSCDVNWKFNLCVRSGKCHFKSTIASCSLWYCQ